MSESEIERLLKPVELQPILGLGRKRIEEMLRSGEIPSISIVIGVRRTSRRVRLSALQEWLRSREGATRASLAKDAKNADGDDGGGVRKNDGGDGESW